MLLLYSIVNLTVGTLLCCYAHFFSLSVYSLLPNVIQHQSFLHFCSQIFTVFPALCWCCSQNRIFNSFSLYVSIQIIIIKEGAKKKVCVFITPGKITKMMLKCKFFLLALPGMKKWTKKPISWSWDEHNFQ